jgi:hypothetical protein
MSDSDALGDQNKSYEALVQSQIEERRANVEKETQAQLAKAEKRRAEEAQANIDYEAQSKRNNEAATAKEWQELTFGMNDTQKALVKEWLGVRTVLARGQISSKDTIKLKAKSAALEKEICKEGRKLGIFYFKPFTVYMSDSGLVMLPDDAGNLSLKRGSFNLISLPSGEKNIEFDSNGLPIKLISWGHFANDLPIIQYYNVVIGESEPRKVIPHKPIFPANYETPTETIRPITKAERKKRKGIVF